MIHVLDRVLVKQMQLEMLADIPVDGQLTKCSDQGCPIVVQQPESNSSKIFIQLARKILEKLDHFIFESNFHLC